MMNHKKPKSRLLTGAIIGAALGVAAGMLFAPKSGKKLRQDIGKRVQDFQKFIGPKIKQLREMTEEQYDTFMENAIDAYSRARKLSEREIEELKDYTEEFWKHFRKHF